MQLVHPSLRITFLGSLGVDFSHNTHHSGNVAGLGLCARHASKTRRHEEHTVNVVATRLLLQLLAGGIEHSDGGAVNNALRTDIHIRTCGHLSILAHTKGIHARPVVGFRIVGDHHTVGHHHPGCILVRGEES